jgi:hypothetical protein
MLKRARDYRLYSRTMMPLVAVYSAGYVIGHVVYFVSGNLGLMSGPLGGLRREFIARAVARPYPSGCWMNWVPVLLCGGFLIAELRRQRGRRVAGGERVLLGAYSVATLAAAIVVLAPHAPEALYGATAVLAASLFVGARWRKWPGSVRLAAIGVAGLAAGLAMLFLRLRDMSRLGQLG